jgi:carbon storage regulator CsrA
MLVLTRRPGESIVIGGNIRVTVVEVSGTRIRLGIDAPPEISVDRKEIHDRRMQFNELLDQRMGPLVAAPTKNVSGPCHRV